MGTIQVLGIASFEWFSSANIHQV